MNELAEKLLEAHVQYQLNAFGNANLEKNLRKDLNALYLWLGDVTIADVVSQEMCLEGIKRHLVEGPPPPKVIQELVKECGDKVYKYLKSNQVQVKDVLSKARMTQMTQRSEPRKKLRKKVIHAALNISLYADLISEVMYTSMKEFMLSENPLAKKIPAAGKLLKMGKNFVSQNFSGLEAGLEKNIKSFILRQIQDSIKQSEEFLNETLDSDFYEKLIEEVWQKVSKAKISSFMKVSGRPLVEETEPLIEGLFEDIRKNPITWELINEIVGHLYKKLGDRTVQSFLKEDLGWTQQRSVDEATQWVLPIFQKAIATGFIEERLRVHLEKFYQSPAATKILA